MKTRSLSHFYFVIYETRAHVKKYENVFIKIKNILYLLTDKNVSANIMV